MLRDYYLIFRNVLTYLKLDVLQWENLNIILIEKQFHAIKKIIKQTWIDQENCKKNENFFRKSMQGLSIWNLILILCSFDANIKLYILHLYSKPLEEKNCIWHSISIIRSHQRLHTNRWIQFCIKLKRSNFFLQKDVLSWKKILNLISSY